jgi:hypothetical protein
MSELARANPIHPGLFSALLANEIEAKRERYGRINS